VRYPPTIDEEIAQYANASLDDVRAFHAQFAGGAAAEIAIVGDFDPAAVREQLEALFGTWKAASPYARVPEPLVAKPARALVLEAPEKANASMHGTLALPLTDASPDYPAMTVAAHILGEGGNGRLWKRIREQDGLSYSVGAWLDPSSFEPNTPLALSATFAPENRERLAKALAEELARFARDGVTDAEVAEAKSAVLKRRQLSRTQDASLAASLAQQAHLGRTFAFSGKIDATIEALTTADVNAAIRKYVQPEAFAYAYAGTFAK
jgi:zinc protease